MDSRFQTKRWRSTGVCPLGAQVARTEGSNDTPVSSSKTINAFWVSGRGGSHSPALAESGRPPARCHVGGPFLSAPRRTALAGFPRTRLSSDSCRECLFRLPSGMDGLVASPASDQRFAFPCRHQPEPGRNLLPFVTIEVSHLAKLVDLNTNRATTQLACVSLEPFEQLRALRVRDGWSLIDEDGIFSASDRKAPELSYQGFLPRLTLDDCLKAPEFSSWSADTGAVFPRHLGHRALVLVGKRLEHRSLDRPFQSVQLTDVVGQEVVVDVAPEFCPELANDAEIIIIDELGARVRFATSFISCAFRRIRTAGTVENEQSVRREAYAGFGDAERRCLPAV